jgi:hypothetical protein
MIAVALAASQAAALLSFGMFEVAMEVTLSGSVSEFQWTNQHSWLQLEAGGQF